MLALYFFTRIYYNFFIFCIILSTVFSIGSIALKIHSIQTCLSLPFLFFTTIPLILSFSIPIASSIAVYTVITSCINTQEFIVIRYLAKSRKMLFITVFLFSSSLVPFFFLLIFQWAPSVYVLHKQCLLSMAGINISNLQEDVIHATIPNMTIYFYRKCHDTKKSIFQNLLLMLYDKNSYHLFLARTGIVVANTLHLYNGTVVYFDKNKEHLYVAFDNAVVHLNKLLCKHTDDHCLHNAKSLTFQDFLRQPENNLTINQNTEDKSVTFFTKSFIEKHKRLAQVFWLWIFPLLTLFCIMIFINQWNYTFIKGIFINLLLFLLMHVSITLGQVTSNIIIMYVPIVLVTGIIFTIYKKRYL